MILGFATQIEVPFRSDRFFELCRMIRDHLDVSRLDFYFRKIEYLQCWADLKKAEKTIAAGRGGTDLLLRTGYGYCLWGDYLKAKEYLELAFGRDPSRTELKEDLAEILLFAGEVDRGLRLQREAAAVTPHDAGPLVRQGHLLLAVEDRKRAIACFLKGTGLSLSADQAHLALSLVYGDMGIDGLARQHFNSAVEKTRDARLRAHLRSWRRYRDRLTQDGRFLRHETRRLRLFQTERRLRKSVYWGFMAALVANAVNMIATAFWGHGIVSNFALPFLWGLLGIVSILLLLLWLVRRLD